MKIVFNLLLLLSLCFYAACDFGNTGDEPKTELEKLPPITTTGENTFGCLVNGEALVVTNTQKLGAIYQQGILQLGGGVEGERYEQGLSILLFDPIDAGIDYNLVGLLNQGAKYSMKDLTNNVLCTYDFFNTYYGKSNFSMLDKAHYIISGTFEFSTVTQNCDTVRITDGRFDIQYIP